MKLVTRRKRHEGISERENVQRREQMNERKKQQQLMKLYYKKKRIEPWICVWAGMNPHLHLLYGVEAIQWMRAPCIPNRWCIMLHFPSLLLLFCLLLHAHCRSKSTHSHFLLCMRDFVYLISAQMHTYFIHKSPNKNTKNNKHQKIEKKVSIATTLPSWW